jgi:hypothetical protein
MTHPARINFNYTKSSQIGEIIFNREDNSIGIVTEKGLEKVGNTPILETIEYNRITVQKWCKGCGAPIINNYCKYCGDRK